MLVWGEAGKLWDVPLLLSPHNDLFKVAQNLVAHYYLRISQITYACG